MNNKYKLKFLASLLSVVVIVAANGSDKQIQPDSMEIKGAFGFNLGDTYDTKGDEFHPKDKYQQRRYFVVPPKPLDYFNQYSIDITPKSHKIHTIIGSTNYKTYNELYSNYEIISKILQNKYCKVKKPRVRNYGLNKITEDENKSCKADARKGSTKWSVEGRSIYLSIIMNDDSEFSKLSIPSRPSSPIMNSIGPIIVKPYKLSIIYTSDILVETSFDENHDLLQEIQNKIIMQVDDSVL